MSELTFSDKLQKWLAYHLPRKVVYWCAIRLMTYATTGQYGDTEVPALTAMDAINRWGKRSF